MASADLEDAFDELQSSVDAHAREIRKLRAELEELKGLDQERAEALQEANKNMEKLLNKRGLAATKRDDNIRKIRDLGTVPHAELDR